MKIRNSMIEKRKMPKKLKTGQKAAAAAGAVIAALSCTFAAFADTAVYPDRSEEQQSVSSEVITKNNFSRSADEWSRLQDNRLDWDEIPALVHEYNASVITNRSELEKDERRSMDAQEVSSYLLGKAGDYEAQADELDGDDSKAVMAANLRTNANSLRRQADSNLDDYEVIKLSYDQIEKQTVLNAKTQFINYYTALANKENSSSNLNYLEKAYNSSVNRKNANVGTELEVLTAKLAWEDAEASLVTVNNDITANRQSLIVSCGWKYDSNPEIGKMPEYTAETAAAVSYDSDKAKAQEANITLKIDGIRLANAKDSGYQTLVSEQETTLKNDTDSFGISFKSMYDGLMNSVSAYSNALSAKTNSDRDLEYARKQYELGIISKIELTASENKSASAELAVTTAYNSMVLARVKYDAAVNDGII